MERSVVSLGLHQTLTNPDGVPMAMMAVPVVFTSKQLSEVMSTITTFLGAEFREEIVFERDGSELQAVCTFRLPVNPLAENDTLHRMLILAWMSKRLAMLAPAIDVTGIGQTMQSQPKILH